MKQVEEVTGTVCPLDRADVDTDQIIPKQFLKRVDRTGFGPFAFHGWRYDDDGEPVASFPMNRPEHDDASILLAGPNFGCGSSREHAVWALDQAGFDAVIAPSFADIFRNNCAKIGLLTVELPAEACRRLVDLATQDPQASVRIDLPEQQVVTTAGVDRFEIDAHTKHLLVEGLDDIALSLRDAGAIDRFEASRPAWMPRTR